MIDHGIWPLDFNNKNRQEKYSYVVIYFKFYLIYVCSFSRVVFYFSHAIAIAKATMAMVGHVQPNPKKEIL
jgi:hypothetical protein